MISKKIKNKLKPNSRTIITGSDSSGGASIQADVKTVTALGSCTLTAITAGGYNSNAGVKSIMSINPKVSIGVFVKDMKLMQSKNECYTHLMLSRW